MSHYSEVQAGLEFRTLNLLNNRVRHMPSDLAISEVSNYNEMSRTIKI